MVSVFAWSVAKDKIPTIDNLIQRIKINVNRCCVCFSEGESVAHLFIHCLVGMELWAMVFVWWDILWLFSSSVIRADSRIVQEKSG